MALPQKFIDEGLELAKGAKLFGVDLESLTREELLAACAKGWEAERNARGEGMKQLEFMRWGSVQARLRRAPFGLFP